MLRIRLIIGQIEHVGERDKIGAYATYDQWVSISLMILKRPTLCWMKHSALHQQRLVGRRW